MLIPRKEIVMELCGSARAKDPHVAQALRDHYGEPGRKAAPGPTYGIKGHEWQALAVAYITRLYERAGLAKQTCCKPHHADKG
jgi:hypothetical protein